MDADLWRRLELRHLAALRAVAEKGSFAAAAAKLGYTHSAVSQQIAMLERILGAAVIVRRGGRKPAELTAVGKTLASHAELILTRLQAAQADIEARIEGEARPLRIGSYESIAMRILPALLREFRRTLPQVPVHLSERSRDADLVEAVAEGRLDFALTTLSEATRRFAEQELLRDPFVLVVPTDSPLAQGRKPVRVTQRRSPVDPLVWL